MKAFIADKKIAAKDTLWVKFDLESEVDFKPGQFFFITLPELKYDDQRGDTRHFSIVNSPTRNKQIEMTTRLRGSGFKKTLQELPLGAEVEIKNISGEFVLSESEKPLVFLAGGIGITPFISMIRYINDKTLFDYKIVLICSDDSLDSVVFLKELTDLTTGNDNFKLVLTITRDPNYQGEKRHISTDFLKDYLSPNLNTYHYMVAGPPRFTEGMLKVLQASGVDELNIKWEKISGY